MATQVALASEALPTRRLPKRSAAANNVAVQRVLAASGAGDAFYLDADESPYQGAKGNSSKATKPSQRIDVVGKLSPESRERYVRQFELEESAGADVSAVIKAHFAMQDVDEDSVPLRFAMAAHAAAKKPRSDS